MKNLPRLDKTGLLDWCDSSTWSRSLGVLRSGLLQSLSVAQATPLHGWRVEGRVQNAEGVSCEVVAQLDISAQGDVTGWDGACSCQLGSGCEHAMALTLAAIEQSERGVGAEGAVGAVAQVPEVHPLREAAVPPWAGLPPRPSVAGGALSSAPAVPYRVGSTLPPVSQPSLPSDPDALWPPWLQAWDRATAHSMQEDAAEGGGRSAASGAVVDQYVYLLTTSGSAQAPQLRLEAAVSRPRRAGGWAPPTALNTPPLPGQTLFDRASEADQQTLQLLVALSNQQHAYLADRTARPAAHLSGPLAALALQQAVATGRLLVDGDAAALAVGGRGAAPLGPLIGAKALAWGKVQTLQWSWVETAVDPKSDPAVEPVRAWKLQPQLPSASALLCHNRPLMYVDVALGLCGLVRAEGLSAEQLALLLASPPLQSASLQVDALKAVPSVPCLANELLRRLGPALPWPPPLVALPTVQGVPPIARLHLALVRGATQEQDVLGAELRFDYQGHVGWWPEQGRVVLLLTAVPLAHAKGTEGQVLLQRDVAAEAEALARLAAWGWQSSDRIAQAGDGVVADHGRFLLDAQHLSVQGLAGWADGFQALRDGGFAVTVDEASFAGWVTPAEGPDGGVVVSLQPQGEGGAASPWFDLSLGMEIQGQRHNILPWLPGWIAAAADAPPDPVTGKPQLPPFVHAPAPQGWGYVRLSTQALRPWMDALFDLVGERAHNFGAARLKLSRAEALRTQAALDEGVLGGAPWQGSSALQAIVHSLQSGGQLPQVPLPASVRATLRPYQQQGLNWLQFLRAHGLGGVLADDMGLGKTLQTLAHIQVEKDAGRLTRPALVIAPVSLLGNWQREAERFCPGLRCLVKHGAQRHGAVDALADQDVVIAPYSLLQRDRERWLAQDWHLVVLDEAQNIKNASSQAAQVVGELRAQQRLCLSGTPMENHLGEIWSLFHFVMPGFLGSQARFNAVFRQPIEKQGHPERMAQLRARMAPFMLRRSKALVAGELPPKVETVMPVVLQGAQADLYETIRLATERTVREALASQGLAPSQVTILDALLKLRQVCCDPRLVALDAARELAESAKLEQLMALLPEMLAEGRRVLVFSQFTRMLSLIETELKKAKLPWVKLTGQSVHRDALVARFTSGEVPLFLISLKAGGVGLNLPQADTVIHVDPWWNPAAEAQATDRAHRIGQTQSLWVIKLVAQGTIEERILALQERKARLAADLYQGASARQEPLFTEGDLATLLQPLPARDV